jgi:hypothetical protein
MVRWCRHSILRGIAVLCMVLFLCASVSAIDIPIDPSRLLGTLSVTSTPSGANVWIDDVNRGQTPYTTALSVGYHLVTVRMAGYQDYGFEVEIASQATTSRHAVLAPVVTTGTLSVDSTPRGASVSVDGQHKGITPVTVPNLPAGSYTLSLTLAGYQDITEMFSIITGQTTSYAPTLVPVPQKGTLSVTSTPSGAAYYVDGVARGSTPGSVTGLDPGTHEVRVTKAGYTDFTDTVTITAGQTTSISAPLQAAAPAGGSVAARSSPSGAAVYLDSQARGTTPTTLSGVTAGDHVVKITKSGYEDYTVTVTVADGATTEVDATLKPAGSSSTGGTINTSSIPSGAAVYVDSVPRGTTPVSIQGVASGSHTVKFTLTGYQDVTRSVTVMNGETTQVSATFAAASAGTGGLNISSVPAGATITIDGANKGTTPVVITGLDAGTHSLKLSKAGYRDYSSSPTVVGGKTKVLAFTLQAGSGPSPGPGTQENRATVVVVSSPPGAAVVFDTVPAGTAPVTLPDVLPGSHILTLTMDGYRDSTTSVTVDAGETQQAAVIMEKDGNGPAGLGAPGLSAVLGVAAFLFIVSGRKGLHP